MNWDVVLGDSGLRVGARRVRGECGFKSILAMLRFRVQRFRECQDL